MCPRGRDVEGEDFGALVGRADGKPIRPDDAKVQVVVGIRRLKPGARELEIEVHRVFWRNHVIEAVE